MRLFRLTFLFFTVVGIARSEESRPTIASFFQTSENRGIVASPQKADVCILREKKSLFSKRSTGKYKEGEYVILSSEAAALIGSKLRDEKTYDWESLKMCHPIYNARVRFHRDGHFVYADFCFGCDILRLGKDGIPFGGANFDEVSDEIFEVIRSHFPKDSVVQAVQKQKKQRVIIRAQMEEAIRLDREKKSKQQATSSETPSVVAP